MYDKTKTNPGPQLKIGSVVEVFKTNVQNVSCADKILYLLKQLDLRYDANFDLEDCDKILRVEHKSGDIDCPKILILFEQMGFCAERLQD